MFLLTGCSTINTALGGNTEKQALAELQWPYGSGALRINVQADPALNNYDGEAHSVVLAVIQSAEAGPFYQLLQAPDQTAKVLQGARAPDGLLQVARFAIEPGKNAQIRLDRMLNARFVGVIAAFYDVPLSKTAKLFNWPVAIDKSGLLTTTYKASPALAGITLKLGAADIANAAIAALPAEKPAKGEVPPPQLVGAVQLTDLDAP